MTSESLSATELDTQEHLLKGRRPLWAILANPLLVIDP